MHFINPRRTCAGGLRYLSCVSVCVCVSVTTLASTLFVSMFQVRYVWLSFRLYSIFKSIKPVQKLWRDNNNTQKAALAKLAPT